MGIRESNQPVKDIDTATAGQFTGAAALDDAPAWEQVSTGRYMPRRIKGSYKGRALG
jgi:hypothetical protein